MATTLQHALILGCGYTGAVLARQLRALQPVPSVSTTSRGNRQDCRFDLRDRSTWKGLPAVDATFWLFAAHDPELTAEFLAACGARLGRLIVVGSTSSFVVEQDGQVINELSPRDLSQDRTACEERLRKHGATLVHASGIYGPGRNPVDWVRSGRVGPSARWLNVIHVEDLSRILIAAYYSGRSGQVYLASDGQPERWSTLCERWQKAYAVQPSPGAKSNRTSKIIDPSYTFTKLGLDLRYPNIEAGVTELENGTSL